jgi:hypothetical protein
MSCLCTSKATHDHPCNHIVGIYIESTVALQGTLIREIDLRRYMEERLECGITFFAHCPRCGEAIEAPINCNHQVMEAGR